MKYLDILILWLFHFSPSHTVNRRFIKLLLRDEFGKKLVYFIYPHCVLTRQSMRLLIAMIEK